MPSRIIKQSICTSESMASLTWFEQVLFIRLIVSADDYGRFDARPAIIRGALFPLDDGVTVKAIRDALHKLSTQGMINLYEVGGKPTLELTAWCKHNNTGDPIVAYSVARMGKDGAGSVSMVNNVSPDSSGNVKLAAADVGALPTAGGDMIGPINMNGQTLSGLNSPTEDAQAATKGYVDLAAYPVGAIYLSAVATSPASLFGGTWERLKDRFLLGAGDSYNAGSTGGEATHKLTVSEIPSHNHVEMYGDKPWGDDSASGSSASTNTATWNAIETKKTNMTGSTGGGNAHNNMPPYLVVYMWKRTA